MFVALRVGPRQVGHDDAIGPTPRQRRRLGANLLGLLGNLQPAKDAVRPAGPIHVREELAELRRFGFGGVDDGLGLFQGAPGHAGHSRNLVARLARGCGNFPHPCALAHIRSLAAAFSSGSSARLMATASESVKSLRWTFSANSPRTTSSRSMTLTGIVFQPSSCA